MPNKMTDNEIEKYFLSLYKKLLDVKYDLKITQKEFLALNRVINLLDHQKAENERLKAEAECADGYADALVERTKAEAVKEVFEKIDERLAVHSFTSNSTEYTDGMLDCMEWVDSKLDELKKEMVGENDAD